MFVESPFRFHPLEVRYKNTTMNFHSCVMLFWVPSLQNSAYIYLLRTAFFLPSSYILGHLQSHSIGECEWVFHLYAVGVRDNSSIYSECIVFHPHFPCYFGPFEHSVLIRITLTFPFSANHTLAFSFAFTCAKLNLKLRKHGRRWKRYVFNWRECSRIFSVWVLFTHPTFKFRLFSNWI